MRLSTAANIMLRRSGIVVTTLLVMFLRCMAAPCDAGDVPTPSRGIELLEPISVGDKVLSGHVAPNSVAALFDKSLTAKGLDYGPPLSLAPPSQFGRGGSVKDWVHVTTCRQWLQLINRGWFAYDTIDMAADSDFLRVCGTLLTIQAGRLAKISFLPEERQIDIRQFSPFFLDLEGTVGEEPDSEAARAEKDGRSIGDLLKGTKPAIILTNAPVPDRSNGDDAEDTDPHLYIYEGDSTPNRVVYTYQGYSMQLELIARGDIMGDGVEEYLAYYTAHVNSGTETDALLLVLSRRSANATIAPVACISSTKGDCYADPIPTLHLPKHGE